MPLKSDLPTIFNRIKMLQVPISSGLKYISTNFSRSKINSYQFQLVEMYTYEHQLD